jgi:hypothetical protein
LKERHTIAEEVMRVVMVYENKYDPTNTDGRFANIVDKSFRFNERDAEFHAVIPTYVSAVDDFIRKTIQPAVAWNAADNERNMSKLELDMPFVDNYWNAAWAAKSYAIDLIDGGIWGSFDTGYRAFFHEFGEVVAVKHRTVEGFGYMPMSIEKIQFKAKNRAVHLGVKLYLSAAFDRRIAKVESTIESTLTPTTADTGNITRHSTGGFAQTGTGDGNRPAPAPLMFEPEKYEIIPGSKEYSPRGRHIVG